MRSKPINHEKHEKMAITAFIITLAVSILAFYYVYHQSVQYGKSVEGVLDFAKAQWAREHPGEPFPAQATVAQTDVIYCVGQKETLQNNGCKSVNSVCISVNSIMRNDAYKEYLLSACTAGDTKCMCDHYFEKFEAHTDITETVSLGAQDKCPFIHKKVCPSPTA